MTSVDPIPQCTKCQKLLPEGTHHFLVRSNGKTCIQVRINIYRQDGKYIAEAIVDD